MTLLERANRDVCAIVRCYNEATVVGAVITELREQFPCVLAVDDGSSDGSAAIMRSAGARVLRHAVNLGAGAALQTGLEYALRDPDYSYFLTFDADGQHRVADAVRLVASMRAQDVDVVIGSRFLGGARGMSVARRGVLRGGRMFDRVLSGVRLTDAHNGLRVFNRSFAAKIRFTMADMAYASELSALIARTGARVAEEPVTIDYTDYSRAKGQSSINAVNIAMDVMLNRLLGARSS